MSNEGAQPEAEYLQFGGMAVPEGVMMRSPHYYAVACRAPNQEIVVKTEPIAKTWIGKLDFLKKPFLRGTLALLDTMAFGIRAMNYASNVQLDVKYQTEEEKAKMTASGRAPEQQKKLDNVAIGFTLVFSLAFGFFLFNIVPNMLGQFTVGEVDKDASGRLTNFVIEIIKFAFLIGYLALISRLPAIYEVFKYHGAEHKAINTIEADQPLDVPHCMAQTRLHPRCGTNFAIIVFLVGMLILTPIDRHLLVPKGSPAVLIGLSRVLTELLIMPIIAGISYEIIRAAGKAKDQKWVNILLKPGLATQLITTAPPDEKHVEVAIRSLQAVLRAEQTGELENTEIAEAVEAATTEPDPDPVEDRIS